MNNLKKTIVLLALVAVALTLSSVTVAQAVKQGVIGERNGPPNFQPSPQGAGCAGDVITDLHVTLQIQHTWVGDLQISLTSPAAGPILIVDRPGVPALGAFGCSSDDYDVELYDTAGGGSVENQCSAVPPAIAGDRVPSPGLLAAFDGETLNGNWTLGITDAAAGDSGRLLNWCLAEGAGEQCCSAPNTVIADNTISNTMTIGGTTADGNPTPAVGTWGILAMISLLLAASLFHFRRRAEQV